MSARRRQRGDTTIVRVERTQPHVSIPNATVRDTGISLQAVGLLAFVLALPDDWIFRGVRWLAKHRKVGRDRVAGAIRELRRAGYCRVTRDRDQRGRISATVYTFRDVRGAPDLSTVTTSGFPGHGKPGHGKPTTTKPESTNPESTNPPNRQRRARCENQQKVFRDQDEDDDRALRALLERYADDLPLALGMSRHDAEAWTLDMVRKTRSAAQVLDGLGRAMPRIRAGDAGGPPAKTRSYLEVTILKKRTPASQRSTAGTAGAHAGAIVAGLTRGRR